MRTRDQAMTAGRREHLGAIISAGGVLGTRLAGCRSTSSLPLHASRYDRTPFGVAETRGLASIGGDSHYGVSLYTSLSGKASYSGRLVEATVSNHSRFSR